MEEDESSSQKILAFNSKDIKGLIVELNFENLIVKHNADENIRFVFKNISENPYVLMAF